MISGKGDRNKKIHERLSTLFHTQKTGHYDSICYEFELILKDGAPTQRFILHEESFEVCATAPKLHIAY